MGEYKKSETALSKFIWDKGLNMDAEGEICEPNIKWSILKQCTLYKPGQRDCDLCLSEKALIIMHLRSPKCINKKRTFRTNVITKKHGFIVGCNAQRVATKQRS